ncbi:MAG: GWxTD domain-containing protein [Candidatus Fermentibacteraceae bacterium]|nr:GWxTD domain-containing protein [Candidatus Fermentibacteraceae bacterium]
MILTVVLTTLALTGFSLSWSSLPAGSENFGSAEVTVLLAQDDLLAVSTEDGLVVRYEITSTIDGEGFLRRSGRTADSSFPISEVLPYNLLSAGGHVVSVTLRDLESGAVNREEIEVFIDTSSGSLWSSGGVRVTSDGFVRASGYVTLSWSVYIPDSSEVPQGAYALLDRSTDVEREGWLEGELQQAGVASFTADVLLDGLEKGRYRFTVAALQGDSVVASSSTSVFLLEAWDVWGDDVDETTTLIRPIASAHEIRELERAGGLGDRNSVMADFWTRRDNNPVTRDNEYLDAYLLRLDRISREFGTTGIRGINTDRGIVFAKMGEPDIVENFPFEDTLYPYIKWEYFTPSLSLSFIDHDGYGLYEMVEGWDTVDRAFNSREDWSND